MIGGAISSDADPDSITAEAATFSPPTVPFTRLWTDADKILLVHEGFATGEVGHLITKNGLEGKHNKADAGDG